MKASFKLLNWWLNVSFEEGKILEAFTSSNPVFVPANLRSFSSFAKTIAEELEKYEETGIFDCLKFEIDYSGCSDFDMKVYEELRKVPSGRLVTYGELAVKMGNPRAARAIGQSMRRNKFQVFVP